MACKECIFWCSAANAEIRTFIEDTKKLNYTSFQVATCYQKRKKRVFRAKIIQVVIAYPLFSEHTKQSFKIFSCIYIFFSLNNKFFRWGGFYKQIFTKKLQFLFYIDVAYVMRNCCCLAIVSYRYKCSLLVTIT